jgi:hypothetical protein
VPQEACIQVEPLTIDDWEIVELNAGFLESSFLNQARVVQQNEILSIWIHDKTCVSLKVGKQFLTYLEEEVLDLKLEIARLNFDDFYFA